MKPFRKKLFSKDVVIGLLLFAISFPFLLTMHHFVAGGTRATVSPLFFPRFVITIVVLLSIVLTGYGLFGKSNGSRNSHVSKGGENRKFEQEFDHINPVNVIGYLAILFLYFGLLHYIGFLIATPIVMLLVAYLLNGRNFLKLALMAVGFSVVLFYTSMYVMKIILPTGILFE